jgi:N-terminal C2 in EEIG1 and EHBP1 proteins
VKRPAQRNRPAARRVARLAPDACRTEAVALVNGEANFAREVQTQHTFYRTTNNKYLQKNVTVEVHASSDAKRYHLIGSLVVDLGTMCNTSNKGMVNAELEAQGKGGRGQVYRIEVRPRIEPDAQRAAPPCTPAHVPTNADITTLRWDSGRCIVTAA